MCLDEMNHLHMVIALGDGLKLKRRQCRHYVAEKDMTFCPPTTAMNAVSFHVLPNMLERMFASVSIQSAHESQSGVSKGYQLSHSAVSGASRSLTRAIPMF